MSILWLESAVKWSLNSWRAACRIGGSCDGSARSRCTFAARSTWSPGLKCSPVRLSSTSPAIDPSLGTITGVPACPRTGARIGVDEVGFDHDPVRGEAPFDEFASSEFAERDVYMDRLPP